MSDSEESDGEAGLGNLNRLVVRPPGHSGKAKRGQLCFDAAFECGNLGRADHVTELEYDLFIRPDTCRPRARFWFNFTVENVKLDQRVVFNLVNFGKDRTLYNGEMTPLVRSTSRQKWQRIPRRLVFYHRSVAHRGRRILSFAFAFDREEDVYQFAAAAPYSYSRLQKHLTLWEKRAGAFAKRESIAQTTQKRRIDLLTVGNFDTKPKEKENKDDFHNGKNRATENKKRVVIIISRVHGGEPPASFICQGFIDFLIGSSEKAAALREGIVIQVIPMLNPDGVFLGNQRSDLLGSDLNRCYAAPTTFSHPALVALNEHVKKVINESTLQLDFVIDLHADISHEGVFVRGNSYDNVYRFERHAVLPKFLSGRVEAWHAECCLYNGDAAAAGSARRTLAAAAPAVDSYTLLASMSGRRVTPKGQYMHYTEDAYVRIGRSLAKTLCDYYRHVGVIPPRAGGGVVKKKKESRGRRRKRIAPVDRDRSQSMSSVERRVLRARVVTPPLPPASLQPPAPARAPARAAPAPRPRTVPDLHPLLPLITGTAVRTPRLSVVDLSAHIRAPRQGRPAERRPRPPHRRALLAAPAAGDDHCMESD